MTVPGTSLEAHFRADLALLPERLAERFVAMRPDSETERFVRDAQRRRASPFATRLHRWLGRFMSDFDINGLLGLYPMYLLGTEPFRELLTTGRTHNADGPTEFGSLLDVGAGSGDVTQALAPLFERVTAFETSTSMRRRLRQRGFDCVSHDLAREPTTLGAFDVVALLNVLDRCQNPRRLLDHAIAALAERGRLLIALALPYTPFYYDQGRTLDPIDPLDVSGASWERACVDLVQHELEPRGLSVVCWTRAPYLSAGDSRQALYVLSDAVIVLERAR